ncbi:hemicentin-1 [Caerostris extrusa]|uniref:Hemicentin-1 n=1 Tax=Caerostris extrusa TaxID=172846 RepID=A0AAV4Q4W2_CAEEX|nr:hemicentin-1 [Caerostris extrusa]
MGKRFRNGRQNIHIASLPLISSLIIDPLRSDDTGNYTCVVSSRGTSGSFTTSLDVMGLDFVKALLISVPPSWNIAPSDTHMLAVVMLLILNCKGTGEGQNLRFHGQKYTVAINSLFLTYHN